MFKKSKLHKKGEQSRKEAIEKRGHRRRIGGGTPEKWYGIGRLQYHFVVEQGLKHDERFLDIGCGALRLGQFIIPYLDKEMYYGLEAVDYLVEVGIEKELGEKWIEIKSPKFSFNSEFDFSFCPGFEFAIAQSVFTHININDICTCFRNLLPISHKESKFYFTYSEGSSDQNPNGPSGLAKNWKYNADELIEAGRQTGWSVTNIGEWNHPRGQKMMLARPA